MVTAQPGMSLLNIVPQGNPMGLHVQPGLSLRMHAQKEFLLQMHVQEEHRIYDENPIKVQSEITYLIFNSMLPEPS
jgi:hypothetical protein